MKTELRLAALVLTVLAGLGSAPAVLAQTTDTPLAETRPSGAQTVAHGTFRDGDPIHRGSGALEVLRTGDGGIVVRLENMQIVPGPNLFVYLAADPDPLFPEDVTASFVSLGKLKSRAGDQNYVVPEGVDLSKWGSVVVWCDTFMVPFAVASIERR